MNQNTIYLDYAATTPVDNKVLDEIRRISEGIFGNSASGSHSFGWQAEGVLRAARQTIAQILSADSRDIFFTSGATESNNWVLQRIAGPKPAHFISTKIEHKSVLEPLNYLEQLGHEVTYLPVSPMGLVNPEELLGALKPETVLVSMMLVNNETGTLQNIKELAGIVHQNSKARFHTDATQAVGKIAVSVNDLDIDFLSASAHKFYGPKGVGILIAKNSIHEPLAPLIFGGGHEFGQRAGTVNTPGIHGMASALELASKELNNELSRINALATDFFDALSIAPERSIVVNGSRDQKIPHIINLTTTNIPSGVLLPRLSQFALSAGAACATGSGAGSYVIRELTKNDQTAACSFRISLGRATTSQQLQQLAKELIKQIKELKDAGFC